MKSNNLISFLTLVFTLTTFYFCTKEYSCEGSNCRIDTFYIPSTLRLPDRWPPRDTSTVFNNLICIYSFYIVDNSKVRKIYFNVQDKYIPGHYYITDSITVQTTPDGYYNGSFDIKNYPRYINNSYKKGDTFKYFFEIRYKNGDYLRSDTITLKL